MIRHPFDIRPGRHTLGSLSGYYGGIIDELLMRLTDVMWAIPTLVLAMAIVVAFERGLDEIMIALALVHWRWYVRVIRYNLGIPSPCPAVVLFFSFWHGI